MDTFEEVNKIFYTKNGELYWKIKHGKVSPGQVAGNTDSHGYRCVRYLGKIYKVHILLWVLYHKEYPTKYLVHKDGNNLNNKENNLCYKGEDAPDPITQGYLKLQLNYNPETGIFTRKISKSGKHGKAGEVAGTKVPKGYIEISLGKRSYGAHQLAVLYMEGFLPELHVDHRNRVRDDNKWSNLRFDVGHTCQARNRGVRSDNSSGVVGVHSRSDRPGYTAKICVNGKTITLGQRLDFEEAVCRRYAAEQCVGWGTCDSDSSSKKYVENFIQNKEVQQ